MMDMDHERFFRLAPSIVAPVVVATSKGLEHIGTAFCVSPSGIWITARHILEGRKGYEDYEYRTQLFVSTFTVHPKSGSDLALLWVDRPDISFPATQLNAFVPERDSKICGLGYPKFENGVPMLKVAPGIISNCYPRGRDTFQDLDGNFTGKLPTPSYETTATFDSLMSGGPVFQPDGSVCGVVATGVDEGAEGEPAVSFASATPYIFMLNVAYSPDNIVSLYHLAKRGVVLCDDSIDELIVIEENGMTVVGYANQLD
jgi:S1-C subfamily serine protease